MARELSSAERRDYPLICEMWYCTMPISGGNKDGEINIDGLPDYRMGELADEELEEVEFFSD